MDFTRIELVDDKSSQLKLNKTSQRQQNVQTKSNLRKGYNKVIIKLLEHDPSTYLTQHGLPQTLRGYNSSL